MKQSCNELYLSALSQMPKNKYLLFLLHLKKCISLKNLPQAQTGWCFVFLQLYHRHVKSDIQTYRPSVFFRKYTDSFYRVIQSSFLDICVLQHNLRLAWSSAVLTRPGHCRIDTKLHPAFVLWLPPLGRSLCLQVHLRPLELMAGVSIVVRNFPLLQWGSSSEWMKLIVKAQLHCPGIDKKNDDCAVVLVSAIYGASK